MELVNFTIFLKKAIHCYILSKAIWQTAMNKIIGTLKHRLMV